MSADLYLHDLAATPVEIYREWLDTQDPMATVTTLLADRGYDLNSPDLPQLPAGIVDLIVTTTHAIDKRNRRAEQHLSPWSADQVWIGPVSWLKAGLLGDAERYIPGTVNRIADLYTDAPILTPGLLAETTVAFNLPNRSIYRRRSARGLERPRVVKRWLQQRIGHRIYTTSQ